MRAKCDILYEIIIIKNVAYRYVFAVNEHCIFPLLESTWRYKLVLPLRFLIQFSIRVTISVHMFQTFRNAKLSFTNVWSPFTEALYTDQYSLSVVNFVIIPKFYQKSMILTDTTNSENSIEIVITFI